MLREVDLPQISGRLYLSSMPGRDSSLDKYIREVEDNNINTVVSLTGLEEIRDKSPEYAKAIENNSLDWNRVEFPIKDYSVPQDRAGYMGLINNVAEQLRRGENILIHCGAGIGRTGTLAACVLIALGVEHENALAIILRASSKPENEGQKTFVRWFAAEVQNDS